MDQGSHQNPSPVGTQQGGQPETKSDPMSSLMTDARFSSMAQSLERTHGVDAIKELIREVRQGRDSEILEEVKQTTGRDYQSVDEAMPSMTEGHKAAAQLGNIKKFFNEDNRTTGYYIDEETGNVMTSGQQSQAQDPKGQSQGNGETQQQKTQPAINLDDPLVKRMEASFMQTTPNLDHVLNDLRAKANQEGKPLYQVYDENPFYAEVASARATASQGQGEKTEVQNPTTGNPTNQNENGEQGGQQKTEETEVEKISAWE